MALSRLLYICYPNCRALVLKSLTHWMFRYCASLKWWSVNWCALEKGRKSYAQRACKYLGEQTIRGSSLRTQINLIAKHHEKVADQTCARGVKDKKICHQKTQTRCLKYWNFFQNTWGFFCQSLTPPPPPNKPLKSCDMVEFEKQNQPYFFFFFSQQSQSSQNHL